MQEFNVYLGDKFEMFENMLCFPNVCESGQQKQPNMELSGGPPTGGRATRLVEIFF